MKKISSTFLWLVLLSACVIRQGFAFDGASFLRLRTSGKEANSVHSFQRGGAFAKRTNNSVGQTVSSQEELNTPQKQRWSLFRKRTIALAMVPLILTTFLWASGSVAPASQASATSAVLPKTLGKRNLLLSTMVLVSLTVLPLSYFGLTSLAKGLLVSASRCALQVSLLGSIVLQKLMGVTKPQIVLAWILGVGLIAGREAVSRIKYSYPNKNRNLYGSVLFSGLAVLSLILSLDLFGSIQPWFDPRTWIPIAGMLFGNTLNASALGASSITKQFATAFDSVELRWMRGATTQEAVAPLLEESFGVSLMPTINGLAATGIIHIPGMMSGQILAGQSPQQAALYQIVINFLIASTAILSVQLIIHLTVRAVVDMKESRLRCNVLEANDSSKTDTPPVSESSTTEMKSLSLQKISAQRNGDLLPVLELKNLEVPRAKAKVHLELRPGDRIAIKGKSGAGKSQILRTIVGLEDVNKDSHVSLFGKAVAPTDLPNFRSRVCLVPPNRPNLEGTPNQFYQQILKYQKRPQKDIVAPQDIAKSWGLPADALDRDWRTLSSGESQRAALAIALALQPDVLLLDESTSQMDKATSLQVEKTLRNSNIPMIVVTHSEEQLNRFCTHKLVL